MNRRLALFIIVAILLIGWWFNHPKNIETFEVTLTETGFEPSELIVPKGSKVVFSTTTGKPFWPASDPHPLHDRYPVFDAKGPVNPDETWVFKVQKIGEWGFHDHLFFTHKGKLNVVDKKDWEAKNSVLTKEVLSRKIAKDGPLETYENLKKVSDPSSGSAHSNFHLFGEVLYEKKGVSGISVCDDFAGFGCYHGFSIKAVSDKGIQVVKDLDTECVKKFGLLGLGCPHGIGHGLVEFFGYDKINEALLICEGLSWQGSLFGCPGGVFMEYNFRNVFRDGDSTIEVRPAHGNLFEPCRSLGEKFRQACYFEQASWWREVLNSDYEKIGSFCKMLIGEEKNACLLGLGSSVAERSSYNKDEAIGACRMVRGKYEEAFCRTGVAWAFFANPEKRDQSEKICDELGSYQNLCLEKRVLVK